MSNQKDLRGCLDKGKKAGQGSEAKEPEAAGGQRPGTEIKKTVSKVKLRKEVYILYQLGQLAVGWQNVSSCSPQH